MKKRNIVLMIISGILVILFIFGFVLGSFDFTRSKRIGKTNYYLEEGVLNVVGLYYRYPDIKDMSFSVLGGRITDAHWNNEYILVIQYALESDSIKGYCIVKMLPPAVKKGIPCEKIILSTKEEYERKKQELDIDEKNMKHVKF